MADPIAHQGAFEDHKKIDRVLAIDVFEHHRSGIRAHLDLIYRIDDRRV